ncbi:MAG: 4-hydroxybenzoyl-CoA thioesterase [Bacteroidetes bacterium GWA2_31_9b]|nr:MAG: 4-hydroxybenzoyl-CoA thioesterase [Bacteroidetes bacterium GWA2_31_9b]
MIKKKQVHRNELIHRTETIIRFSEVDSMGIVWHGNYAKFFEDGREAFGKAYGISYLDVYANNHLTPLVKLTFDYKLPLEYGDTAIVETRYIDHDAAKIHFEYTIYNKKNNKVCATGESIQVFIDLNRELMLTPPDFFIEWKKKIGLIV